MEKWENFNEGLKFWPHFKLGSKFSIKFSIKDNQVIQKDFSVIFSLIYVNDKNCPFICIDLDTWHFDRIFGEKFTNSGLDAQNLVIMGWKWKGWKR